MEAGFARRGFALRRARCGTFAGDELVCHGEEVVGQLGGAVGEADKNAVVSEVVVGGVVEVGGFGEEGGAVDPVDADEEGVRLGGFVGGDARHHLAVDLEGAGAEVGGVFDAGEGEADAKDGGLGDRHRVQRLTPLWIGRQSPYPATRRWRLLLPDGSPSGTQSIGYCASS